MAATAVLMDSKVVNGAATEVADVTGGAKAVKAQHHATLHNADVAEVLFTKEQIAEAIQRLAKQVAADYRDKAPVIMPILKGGFIVAADFVRALDPCPEGMSVEFVSARSYGKATETSGEVQVSFDEASVRGQHVLLVDDLCDSGLTLLTVHQRVEAAGAASVASLVLLDKRGRRKVDYAPDYIGYDCPNKWVAGLGMDTNQLFRGMGCVTVLTPEAINKALARP